MYELKKIERYLRVILLGPGPRFMKKEFTGSRSHTALGDPGSAILQEGDEISSGTTENLLRPVAILVT